MKKGYTKPMIEIEKYELNASIAANCNQIASWGPSDPENSSITACKEFPSDDWDVNMASYGLSRTGTSFYDSETTTTTCSCYYTSGGEGYFTS